MERPNFEWRDGYVIEIQRLDPPGCLTFWLPKSARWVTVRSEGSISTPALVETKTGKSMYAATLEDAQERVREYNEHISNMAKKQGARFRAVYFPGMKVKDYNDYKEN